MNPLEVADVLPGGVPAVLFNEFGDPMDVFTAVGFWGEEGDGAAAVLKVVRGRVLLDLPA